MADCGSSGTALDRVARTVFIDASSSGTTAAATAASGSNGAQQLLANFIGHAAVSMLQSPQPQLHHPRLQSALADNTPVTMTLPPNTSMVAGRHIAETGPIVPVSTVASPMSRFPDQQATPTGMHFALQSHTPSPMSQQQYPNGYPMHHPQHLQHPLAMMPPSTSQAFHQQQLLSAHHKSAVMMHQQQHHAAARMHQQQFMMAQQQQQHQVQWMQQRHQQQMLQKQQQQQQLHQQRHQHLQRQNQQADTKVGEQPVQGHEGIVQPVSIENLSSAWTEALQDDDQITVGNEAHEGLVESATMEQLAAAWRDAQIEEEALFGDEDYYNNLWTGDGENAATDYFNDAAAANGEQHAPMGQYEFTNPKETWSTEELATNWMEEGYREFNAGNIRAAVKAFEYELLRGEGEGGGENGSDHAASAWRMLGRCHAEHDMDSRAIPCLEQAVEHDPYSAPARLALGVSYVNELNHVQALRHLKAWITHNPKFAGLDVEDVYGSGSGSGSAEANSDHAMTAAEAAFDEVQRLLLSALQVQSTAAATTAVADDATADILEALGVVYNVSRDYDAAVDVFQKACDIRPDDYQLWNKLGATLANSNRSDEALPAYHRALQLKPKYARAWLNMAISHSNLQQYDEAARCYLQTLSLNPAALHCWSYLRIALSCAEEWDLIPATATRDLAAFRERFSFSRYNDA